jgi:hypothetical protein
MTVSGLCEDRAPGFRRFGGLPTFPPPWSVDEDRVLRSARCEQANVGLVYFDENQRADQPLNANLRRPGGIRQAAVIAITTLSIHGHLTVRVIGIQSRSAHCKHTERERLALASIAAHQSAKMIEIRHDTRTHHASLHRQLPGNVALLCQ